MALKVKRDTRRQQQQQEHQQQHTLKPKRVREQKYSYMITTENKRNKTQKSVWNKCRTYTGVTPLVPRASPEARGSQTLLRDTLQVDLEG